MHLAIDAGNTNIVFGLYEGETRKGIYRLTTLAERTADEYAVFLASVLREAELSLNVIDGAILGSVVPEANFHIIEFCKKYLNVIPLLVGTPDVASDLKIELDRPDEVGADRIINAIAGRELTKPPFIVIDFGTATTFDVVNETGSYIGGAIAPGVKLSLTALHMAAAKLPRISLKQPSFVIGKNTVGAIQSGVFWGYASLIEGMVARIKKEFNQPVRVIATGGLASFFQTVLPMIDFYDPDLTLRGLSLLYRRHLSLSEKGPFNENR